MADSESSSLSSVYPAAMKIGLSGCLPSRATSAIFNVAMDRASDNSALKISSLMRSSGQYTTSSGSGSSPGSDSANKSVASIAWMENPICPGASDSSRRCVMFRAPCPASSLSSRFAASDKDSPGSTRPLGSASSYLCNPAMYSRINTTSRLAVTAQMMTASRPRFGKRSKVRLSPFENSKSSDSMLNSWLDATI